MIPSCRVALINLSQDISVYPLGNPMHFCRHYMALANKVLVLFTVQTIYDMDQEYLSKLLQLVGEREVLPEEKGKFQLADQSNCGKNWMQIEGSHY